MRTIDANRKGATILGKYDEHNTTVVRFDVSVFVAEYPGCSITLTHKRARDPIASPVGSFEFDDMYGYWTITAGDTAYVGLGQAELTVMLAGNKRKSITYETLVVESPTQGDTDPVEPFKSWAEKVIEAAEEAAGAADWLKLKNKPDTFPPDPHTHDADDLTFTEKEEHTPGSIGEAIAKALHCKVMWVDELPPVDEKYRGYFAVLFGEETDKIYMLMKKEGTLEWILLHDPTVVPVATYDNSKYDIGIFG